MLPYLIAGAIGYGIAKLFEEDKLSKYADGGLIAPNGKPSNLTPEQYKLVRTPEFKAWFGDWENDPENASKVVDSNGEPLVVFRGDSSETNIFNENTFFSSNDYVAGSYSNVDAIPEYSVFLNIKNPLNLLGGNELRRTPNSVRLSGSDPSVVQIFKEALSNLPNDYTIKVGWGDEWDKKTLYDAVINNYEGIEYINHNNQSASWDAIIKYAKSKGFDGVFMYDESIDKLIQGQFSQITFQPEQIKLADGSNTTFDGNNPDIRFDGGGSTNEEELIIEELKKNELLKNYLTGQFIGKDNKALYDSLKKYIPLKNKFPKIFKPKSNIFYRTDTILRTPQLEYEIMEMGIGQRDLPLIRHLSHFSADLLENVTYKPKNKLQGWTSDKDFVFEHWYNVYVMGQGGDYVFDEENYFSCVYVLKDTTDLLFNEIFLDELRSYFNGNGDESESLRLGSEVNCDVIIITNSDLWLMEEEEYDND